MLKQYWSIYKEFLNQSFSEAMSYRAHFILLMVMDLLFYLSVFGSVDFIFNHVSSIGPWSYDTFMFFVAFMIAIDHLHMTFISESFWNLSEDIRTGKLDFVLIKPVFTFFPIFMRFIRPGTLLNGFVPWGLLIYFGLKLNLSPSSWILLPFLVFSGFVLLTSLGVLISMSMFWTIESFGINFLRMQMQQLSRWPDFIYKTLYRKIFSFGLPILLVGSAPVKFLIDHDNIVDLITMYGLTLATWVLIAVLWKKALSKYESASS